MKGGHDSFCPEVFSGQEKEKEYLECVPLADILHKSQPWPTLLCLVFVHLIFSTQPKHVSLGSKFCVLEVFF